MMVNDSNHLNEPL
jgi:hypothetical protein